MDKSECPLSLEILAVQLAELEKRLVLHKDYSDTALWKAADDLKAKLAEMNMFREENRVLTAKFATMQTVDERVEMLHIKIDALHKTIDEGIGKRLTILELYRANLDGKFWIWGVFITILTLVLQLWPVLRGKVQ